MDTVLMKFYQESLRECQKDIEEMHDELASAQALAIEYDADNDVYGVWDYNSGAKVIFDAVSIEQAREFVFNRAISKLLLS